MNPVQLWAAIEHPQQNYRIHNDNYLKLQRNPLKQVPQSLNLLPQKKTHVDSFFEVFFATYTFSFLSLLTYNTKKIVQVHKNPLIPEPGIVYWERLR